MSPEHRLLNRSIDQVRSNFSGVIGQGLQLIDLANAYRLDDQLAQSLSWARWAVLGEVWGDEPIDQRAWHVLAHTLLDLGRYHEAAWLYQRADPDGTNGRLQHNRARALLGQGAWAEAWALAEQRWIIDEIAAVGFPRPHWLGWPAVTSLTLWDEQGFGDTLQALRWIPEVYRASMQLTLEVRAPLQRLLQEGLQWLGPNLNVRVRDESSINSGCHGSLLSLPALLNAQQWPDPVALHLPKPLRSTGRPRIGLVWEAGRYLNDPSKSLEYRRKTIPSDQLEYLCAAILQRRVDLVLLQPGYDIPDKADFLEQAQAVQRCDLLLSVDTAAAHLGGVIGHPTWLLLPWAAASRWQRHRDDTELYPGMRLVRQPRHGDWPGLIQQVLIALDDWLLKCF